MLRFAKYEGLGNDFIIPIDPPRSAFKPNQLSQPLSEENRRRWSSLCDRRRSIGADGVLLLAKHASGRYEMRVVNQDGSEAEMCGNGLRCLARHIDRVYKASSELMYIETLKGTMTAEVLENDIRCNVGSAKIIDEISIESDGVQFHGHIVDVGNPHFVIFDNVSDQRRMHHAPNLCIHPYFSEGANISFATHVSDDRVRLRVFERGCGWTQACGTAAIATATVAQLKSSEQKITVTLPGGDVAISGTAAQRVMSGPARFVYEGEINFDV